MTILKSPYILFTIILITLNAQSCSTESEEPLAPLNSIGRVTKINGTVMINDAIQLKQGNTITSGVTIVTKADSDVVFTMIDQATIKLGANSKLKINIYDYQQDATDNTVIMHFFDGIFRTISGMISKADNDDYEVTTPLLTIDIEGTDYQINIENKKEFLSTYEGKITVKKQGSYGQPQIIVFDAKGSKRYLRVKTREKNDTRAGSISWREFSQQNKPNDFPAKLEL
jgi:hypothetical protein